MRQSQTKKSLTATVLSTARREISGFTLIELLVVVFIISLLAAMLSPALRNAYDQATFAACQNRLKNIGFAIHAYSNDHRGFTPYGYTSVFNGNGSRKDPTSMVRIWAEAVIEYFCEKDSGDVTEAEYKPFMWCPQCASTQGAVHNGKLWVSYGYTGQQSIRKCISPSKRISNCEAGGNLTSVLPTKYDGRVIGQIGSSTDWTVGSDHLPYKTAALFMDLHVAAMKNKLWSGNGKLIFRVHTDVVNEHNKAVR